MAVVAVVDDADADAVDEDVAVDDGDGVGDESQLGIGFARVTAFIAPGSEGSEGRGRNAEDLAG